MSKRTSNELRRVVFPLRLFGEEKYYFGLEKSFVILLKSYSFFSMDASSKTIRFNIDNY